MRRRTTATEGDPGAISTDAARPMRTYQVSLSANGAWQRELAALVRAGTKRADRFVLRDYCRRR